MRNLNSYPCKCKTLILLCFFCFLVTNCTASTELEKWEIPDCRMTIYSNLTLIDWLIVWFVFAKFSFRGRRLIDELFLLLFIVSSCSVDGLSIGAAFSLSTFQGISIAIACFCEELPHELGDLAILLHSGLPLKRAICYNFMSGLTCFAGFIAGVFLGKTWIWMFINNWNKINIIMFL